MAFRGITLCGGEKKASLQGKVRCNSISLTFPNDKTIQMSPDQWLPAAGGWGDRAVGVGDLHSDSGVLFSTVVVAK